MKIVSYGISGRLASLLASTFGDDVTNLPEPLSVKNANPETAIAIIAVSSLLDATVLSSMPKLRAVLTLSTGTDHIDAGECRRRRIAVHNCSTYATTAVAELAIALALAGLRDIPGMVDVGRNPGYPLGFAQGGEICGKTCAVLGTGRIGSRIAKMLLAFGCKVVAYSRSAKKELSDIGIIYVPLPNALEAELVFISLPNSPETYHLLDGDALSLLKDGSAIVNVSRGEIIDSIALLEHIDRLAFVATDVLEGQSRNHSGERPGTAIILELLKKRNFLRVPYIGVCTEEAGDRLAEEMVAILTELMSKAPAPSSERS